MTKLTPEQAMDLVEEIAREVARDYEVPCNYYGDCYNREVMRTVNLISMVDLPEDILNWYAIDLYNIFKGYALSYREGEKNNE